MSSSSGLRRGSSGKRLTPVLAAQVVPHRVLLPASHIPLPTDPDPDLHGPLTGTGQGEDEPSQSITARPLFSPPAGASPQSRRSAFNSLPTHSRSSTGVPGSPKRTHFGYSSGTWSPVASPDHASRPLAQPPSPTLQPYVGHVLVPGGSLTTATPPQTSPQLRGQSGDHMMLLFAATDDGKAAASSPSDPLLGGGPRRGCCWRSLRGFLLLVFCFITPSRYDALQEAARARAARRHAEQSTSAAFASYTSSARSRRSEARDRHYLRQKKIVAAAEQQHAKLKADEAAAAAAAAAGNESAAATAAAAAAAAEAALARAQLAQQHSLLLRQHTRDSDDEEEQERELAILAAEDQERKMMQRHGPCCDRACFPSSWDDSVHGCCCRCYVECCTVRRFVCVSVYTVLLCCLALFMLYYFIIVRRRGWKWPPSKHDWTGADDDDYED